MRHIFAYNVGMTTHNSHPATIWLQDARQLWQQPQSQLRLAAMAGHMRVDKIAARRAALIDLLADGRPHPRAEIWETVAARLQADCWGAVPREALARDLRALRQGGLRIAYSRRPGAVGYYLEYPPLVRPPSVSVEAINWTLVDLIRKLSPAERASAEFASTVPDLGNLLRRATDDALAALALAGWIGRGRW